MKTCCVIGVLPILLECDQDGNKVGTEISNDAKLAKCGIDSVNDGEKVHWKWVNTHYELTENESEKIVKTIKNCSPIAIFVYGDQLALDVMKLIANDFHGQLPVISTACSSRFQSEWFFGFRFWPDMSVLDWALARMSKSLNIHSYALFYVNTRYGCELSKRIKKRLWEAKCIGEEHYDAVFTRDLSRRAKNLRSVVNSDCVLLIGYGDQYELILKFLNDAAKPLKRKISVITDKFITEFARSYLKSFKYLRIYGMGIATSEHAIKVFSEEAATFIDRAIDGLQAPSAIGLMARLASMEYVETKVGAIMLNPIGETSFHPYGATINDDGAPTLYPLLPERSSVSRAVLLKDIERELGTFDCLSFIRGWNHSGFQAKLTNVARALCKHLNGTVISFVSKDKNLFTYSAEAVSSKGKDAIKISQNWQPAFLRMRSDGIYVEERVYGEDRGKNLALMPEWDDNGTLRLFFVKYGGKISSLCSVKDSEGVVLAKSEISAKFLWDCRRKECSVPSSVAVESLSSGGECVLDFQNVKDSECIIKNFYRRIRERGNELGKGKGVFYEYYVHEPEKEGDGWLCFLTRTRLSYIDVSILMSTASRIFTFANGEIRRFLLVSAYVKSAIGSIMSRNGSHNIGSHVLAALSHNVGTMPDDRVLYQYIQQRMDYIATATTDMPKWSYSTKFFGEMMRRFLSQRHLLDYIAESEGLGAYRFQDRNLDIRSQAAQKNCIRIFVRKVLPDGKRVNLIAYPEKGKGEENECNELDLDVNVAIPGGVVGQQAFFNIVENIIRNAAKHGWSAKGGGNSKCKMNVRSDNLDVYIDVTDDIELYPETIPVVISDNISEVEEAGDGLIERLTRALAEPFVAKETGELRRTNWGLAEMKISAGYLAMKSIGQIGGMDSSQHAFLKPVATEEHHLGFRFELMRPQELLIAVEKKDWEQISGNDKKQLKQRGIDVRQWHEIEGLIDKMGVGVRHRFVILPKLLITDPQLPFHVLTRDPVDMKVAGKCIIPTIGGLYNQIVGMLKGAAKKPAAVSRDILNCVYSCWVKHIVKDLRGMPEDRMPALYIQPVENLYNDATGQAETAGKKCLITDVDIWNVVYSELFRSVTTEFLSRQTQQTPEFRKSSCFNYLLHVSNLSGRMSLKDAIERKIISADSATERDYASLTATMMKVWYDEWRSQEKDSKAYTDLTERKVDTIKSIHMIAGVHNLEEGLHEAQSNLDQNLREFAASGIFPKTELKPFFFAMKAAFVDANVLLRKYEEQIITLPIELTAHSSRGRDWASGDGGICVSNKKGMAATFKLPMFVVTNAKDLDQYSKYANDNNNEFSVNYVRHFSLDVFEGDRMLYAEPLSGTQSYLNSLYAISTDSRCASLAMSLYENGLMRILIIDERVANFVKTHNQARTYAQMGMWVVDDKVLGKKNVKGTDALYGKDESELRKVRNLLRISSNEFLEFKREFTKFLKGGEKPVIRPKMFSRFDMLIIHQGLIDKWFERVGLDEYGMERVIAFFRQYIPYVVITTGRGTPANTPATARILPFSVVQSSIFKKSPEKMVLVNTIMGILPKGQRQAEVSNEPMH